MDGKFSFYSIILPQINQLLKIFTLTYDFIVFLELTKDWLKYNDHLNKKLLQTDNLYLSKFGNKNFASSICTKLQQQKTVSTYSKFVLVSSVVCNSLILSQRICEADDSTVKNRKYSSSCYNTTSVTNVKVFNFFVSCQSDCEVIPVHVGTVHVTTIVIVKHWNEISLYRPRILPAPVTHVQNVSTYVSKSRNVDFPLYNFETKLRS